MFITTPAGQRIGCHVLGAHHRSTAILTSGIGCGPVFMHDIASELARDHRVVYWDYRGHGASEPAAANNGYRIADHASDLDHVVRVFARESAPLMVSFSMGVQVSIEWTRCNPGRAAAHAFLLGVPRNPVHRTVVLRAGASRLANQIARYGRPLLNLMQPFTQAALRTPATYALARTFGIVQPDCPMSAFLDFVDFATGVPLDAYLRCAAGLLEHDATADFMRIQEPVLMMAAEHDVFINAAECRSFALRHPHAKFELLQSASHAGSIEYGTYVARRIRGFLDANRRAATPLAA